MQDAVEDLRQTVTNAAARLHVISDDDSAVRPGPGKWSPREIVGHLIDSAANNHQRFVRAQFIDHLSFDGYEQEDWVAAQRYQDSSWPDLIELWRLYNLHIANVMTNTPADVLTKPRTEHNLHRIAWKTVPEDQPTSLEYFMRDYIGHLKNHLRQILKEI
jgi:hypothetical protein